MKTTLAILTVGILAFGLSILSTPAAMSSPGPMQHNYSADNDDDGTPNCLDDDYIRHSRDGSGYHHRKFIQGQSRISERGNSVRYLHQRNQSRSACNFQNRTGSNGGNLGFGSGTCDGTGPHGFNRRSR